MPPEAALRGADRDLLKEYGGPEHQRMLALVASARGAEDLVQGAADFNRARGLLGAAESEAGVRRDYAEAVAGFEAVWGEADQDLLEEHGGDLAVELDGLRERAEGLADTQEGAELWSEALALLPRALAEAEERAGPDLPGDLVAVEGADYAPLGGLAAGSREAQDRQRAYVEASGLPLRVRLRGLDGELVLVPPGRFRMGSPGGEEDRDDDEDQVDVEITRGFYVLDREVTQELYEEIMGENPSHFQGEGLPVDDVSYHDAEEFLRKLRVHFGFAADDKTYRLLTEAEWEYVCRAGTSTATYFGDSLSSVQANFDGNYLYGGARKGPHLERTTVGGSYTANGWGLYDCHGNLLEWCSDWYGSELKGGRDPDGPPGGDNRVLRGGGWNNDGRYCRSANRNWGGQGNRRSYFGFRFLRMIP